MRNVVLTDTTESTFDQDIRQGGLVLVNFGAPWCGPCKKLQPHLERLAVQLEGALTILNLNVDDARSIASRFGVRSIPQLIAFVAGTEVARPTERTAARLRIELEAQFSACSYSADTSAPSLGERVGNQVEKCERNSFDGDPAAKIEAVTCLRNADKNRWRRPSSVVVGVPRMLASLLDEVVWLQFDEDLDMRAVSVSVVEQVPVGADLCAVAPDVLYDLVYASPWAIAYAIQKASLRDLLSRIQLLHDRERAGDVVSQGSWDLLQREAVLMHQGGSRDGILKFLEALASPSGDWSLVEHLPLLASASSRAGDDRPDWSRVEHDQIAAILKIEIEWGRQEMDGAPGDPIERTAWRRLFEERRLERLRRAREVTPELWARYDTWITYRNSIRHRLGRDLVTRLNVRFSAATMP